MNPILLRAAEYPFAKLLETKRRREQQGRVVIDFGMGDPREPTPRFLRDALCAAVPEISSYPTVRGEASLRRAIAGYVQRRYGVSVDPERHVLPVNGTKEGIFTSHLALIDPQSRKRTVITFEPSYPVYAAGASYAGGVVEAIGSHASSATCRPGYPRRCAARPHRAHVAQLPAQPDRRGSAGGTVRAAARARAPARLRAVLGRGRRDIYFGKPSPSALMAADAPDFKNVLCFHSCSKRSATTATAAASSSAIRS
ncbi:MAG: aminotransferase class I/II-fold pyridoxal phosphate-dependent enzyme [Planctomycetota bacterium]